MIGKSSVKLKAKAKTVKPIKKAAPVKKELKVTKTSLKMSTPKKGPPPPKKASASERAGEKRRSQAAAAMKAAMDDVPDAGDQEEEFDPAAFFAASGGKGIFRAHVMRKERVDFNLIVRYRFLTGPLVYNADLLNLSKGGLCLKTEQVVKGKTVIKIEIPLPHTSELFSVQAECVWSEALAGVRSDAKPSNTGLKFLSMSLAKQTVINNFIQQRRDEIIMAKIGLDKFTDSVPVAGLD